MALLHPLCPLLFPGGDSADDPSDPSGDSDVVPDSATNPGGSLTADGTWLGGTNCSASLLTTAICLHLVQPVGAGGPGVCSAPLSVSSRFSPDPLRFQGIVAVASGFLAIYPAFCALQCRLLCELICQVAKTLVPGVFLYKLLHEPASSTPAGHSRLQAARTGTLRLGLPWPYGTRTQPPFQVDEGSDTSSDISSGDILLDISCLILIPDFEPERVTFEVMIPAASGPTLDTAHQCRAGPTCDLSPYLCPVWPQPDPRWAILLALPTWAPRLPVICLDLYVVDGRVFACPVPEQVDRRFLLTVAGLPVDRDVRIYRSNDPTPISDDQQVRNHTGMCFSFVPAGVRQEASFSFPGLLESHLHWDVPRAFPRAATEDCYCVVTGHHSSLFTLSPVRAHLYRQDLGSVLQIPPQELCLTPAEPRPTDAWLGGFPCRTVVAAAFPASW